MSEAMCAEVHRLSDGKMRNVLNIVANVERIAKESGLEKADVANFQGVQLGIDWASRQPKTVRSQGART
jgi:hypothetical protein